MAVGLELKVGGEGIEEGLVEAEAPEEVAVEAAHGNGGAQILN